MELTGYSQRTFKLGVSGAGPLPYVDETGAYLGAGVRLLERDGSGRWRPRSVEALEALFSAAGWGKDSRYAREGNNFFGIHYPAPYATKPMSTSGSARVAAFASYEDSLRSFVAVAGRIVQGRSDPAAFAAALQNSGKFGINPVTGAKVPGYVKRVAATIRGIRSIIARRGDWA